ncbi:MAG: hypothetical protein LBF55_07915 [Prevotellaceae bacterium]|jgi:hypothetical protein|nr:hypothetical protein [Prevotellaceae bacterium]
MLRAIKHTAKHAIAAALCLLVTGGAVGVRFYVSACMHSGDVQLAMAQNHRCCCGHNDDSAAPKEPHRDGYFASHEEDCCKTSSLSISVSHFEVSQACKLSVDLPFVTTPSIPQHFVCAGGGGLMAAVAPAPRIADAAPAPIIYLHGQLRL